MAFRSPPPHRHSSGHKGGRSDFERAQIALQRTVARLGFHKIPLNDETLRPIMLLLWDFTQRRDLKVHTFDTPAFPGRLYHGIVSNDAIALKKIATDLQNEMLATFPYEEVVRSKPVFTIGKTSSLYFESVWTPVDALDGRKH